MPASFGPTETLPVTTVDSGGWAARVIFETSREAVADLLPRFFEVADTPRVTLAYSRLMGLDWLGGRDYNLLGVFVDAIYRGRGGTVEAPYPVVMWEDDCNPIISGREYLGVPKLYADFSPVEVGSSEFQVSCSAYHNELLSISFSGMVPAPAQFVDDLNTAEARVHWLGWKYIPGTPREGVDPVPDADYPVIVSLGNEYDAAWVGEAKVEIRTPGQNVPISGRIARRLAQIPIRSVESAVACHLVNWTLDRGAARRLD